VEVLLHYEVDGGELAALWGDGGAAVAVGWLWLSVVVDGCGWLTVCCGCR